MLRVRTTFNATVINGGGLNTAYFSCPGGETSIKAQAAVDLMRDFWTAIAGRISAGNLITVSGVVDSINAGTGDLENSYGVTARTLNGSGAGDVLPAQVNGLLALNTITFLNGRRVRGRWFLPTPVEADSTNGIPTAAYATAVNAAVPALLASADPRLVIWSRDQGANSPVTSGVCAAKWGSLRSRRD